MGQKNTQDSEVNRMFNIKVERLEPWRDIDLQK